MQFRLIVRVHASTKPHKFMSCRIFNKIVERFRKWKANDGGVRFDDEDEKTFSTLRLIKTLL